MGSERRYDSFGPWPRGAAPGFASGLTRLSLAVGDRDLGDLFRDLHRDGLGRVNPEEGLDLLSVWRRLGGRHRNGSGHGYHGGSCSPRPSVEMAFTRSTWLRWRLRVRHGDGRELHGTAALPHFGTATLSESSTGFTVPLQSGTFGQATTGSSPGDSTSCFTSSSFGILAGSNEDFGNDFGHSVAAGGSADWELGARALDCNPTSPGGGFNPEIAPGVSERCSETPCRLALSG